MKEKKVAVIAGTGGSRQASFARALAVRDISLALLVHGNAGLPDAGDDAPIVRLDITNEEEIRNAVRSVVESRGKIDYLVTCPDFPVCGALTDTAEKDWEQCVALNLTSVFMICKHVVPFMINSRTGSIINVSSDAGKMGVLKGAAYAAAKAGVSTFSKSLAREVADYGISVNVISAGMIGEDALPLGADAGIGDILLKRKGKWNEVAHMAVCLFDERSSYLTGQTVHVNGGLYMP